MLFRFFRKKQMILYLFNPSHDEALAANSPLYTPSKIAQRLERELERFPAMWAESDARVGLSDMLPADWDAVSEVRPWGWDAVLCRRLRRLGAPARLLPSDERLAALRALSSRATSSRLLPELVGAVEGTFGQSALCADLAAVRSRLSEWGTLVVKAPWSCSGRGVFRVSEEDWAMAEKRILSVLKKQGTVEVQPYYADAFNLAAEFFKRGERVDYRGLSCFLTNAAGAYRGQLVAPQSQLEDYVFGADSSRARVRVIYNNVCRALCEKLPNALRGYDGPVGVDMLLCGNRLMPCLELNLRTTMGFVAPLICERFEIASPQLLTFEEKDGALKAVLCPIIL